MTARDRFGKASQAAQAARESRYLQRLIQDEQLRSNLLAAYGAARSAYGRMSNGTPAGKALFEDRKLQRELAEAAKALREVAGSLKEPPKRSRSRSGGLGRSLAVLLIGGALALALSESLRSKLLDMLFGAEEEFDYSSPPAAPSETPESVASAS